MHTQPRFESAVPPVLLVAEKAETDRILRETLAPTGVHCLSATPGDHALTSLDGELLAVVLDVEHDVEASATTLPLLTKARARNIPVVVVTSETSEAAVDRLCEKGGVECLSRPTSPAARRAKIRTVAMLSANRVRAREATLADGRSRSDPEEDERTRLLALQAEVGLALAANDALAIGLRACAEAIVRHVGAAFARIWALSETEPCLELLASAGMYTHLDGLHGRVPVGQFKIGVIAAERTPHLTNQVLGDPRVGDQAWAQREGMVAFAGYPLVVGERLVGVLALFAKQELSEVTLSALAAITPYVSQVIERARAQERLRLTKEWLSTTLNSIADGVVATDAEGRVTFLNPVACALTGFRDEEARGRPLSDVFRVQDDASGAEVESSLEAPAPSSLRPRRNLVHRDGRKTPIDDRTAPIGEGPDAFRGTVLVFRDQSHERRAEIERADLLTREKAARTAAESEKSRLYQFLMQAPALICVLRGPEHVFELVNPLYEALVGGRDLSGLPIREALPELTGQGYFELLDRVVTTGEAFVGKELPASLVRGADGAAKQGYFDFTYQPMRDIDGAVEGILVLAVEVTEQVVARAALEQAIAEARRLNGELRKAELVLRSVIDNLPDLAWSARPDGHIDFYNRRWYEYTGTDFEKMEGWGWKAVHDPTMVDAVTERWQKSLATGDLFEMEFPLRGADGELRWFLTRVAPLRDDTDTIVRWIGVNTNIHDQRESKLKTEALLSEVSEQALATAEAVRQIVAARDVAERRVSELESRTKARE